MFGCDLKPLPCASTVQNMVSEMKTCALEKAVEGMINSEFINLAFDATSIKDGHVNEIHVNTDSGSCHLLCVMCYCDANDLHFDDLYTFITKTITSTLPEWASIKNNRS